MEYTKEYISEVVSKQREFFNTNATLDLKFRINALKKLKDAVIKNEEVILDALNKDLGRSKTEAYFCDIGSLILEINETLKGIRRWDKEKRVSSGLVCFPSTKTKVKRMPYGVTLIISPFNFPILLSLGVLVASLAAGNTAVIKASSKSVECTKVLEKIVSETFDSAYVTVIGGGHDVADFCLEERFDKIFYTGSPKVAHHVMELASKNLTPVALELGGETGNWAIIDKTANIKDAARKIAFFKACNSGQICINVNQVAVDKAIAKEFIEELIKEFKKQLGENEETIINNQDYAHLINRSAYDKCAREVEEYKNRVIFGGIGKEEELRYCPTIIYPVNKDEAIVNHELFCPILPVVEYDSDSFNDLISAINSREHGLALYLFTKNTKKAAKLMRTMQFGGGCINEVCVHMMVKGAPFNGTGHSGMGAYHGKYGYEEFSHPCTILYGKTKGNLSLRVQPYNDSKLKWIKRFEK